MILWKTISMCTRKFCKYVSGRSTVCKGTFVNLNIGVFEARTGSFAVSYIFAGTPTWNSQNLLSSFFTRFQVTVVYVIHARVHSTPFHLSYNLGRFASLKRVKTNCLGAVGIRCSKTPVLKGTESEGSEGFTGLNSRQKPSFNPQYISGRLWC